MLLYRGKVFNPQTEKRCDYYPDGGLLVEKNKIKAIGDFKLLNKKCIQKKVFETNGIIIPGLADIHLHWVQNRVKGLYQKELLPWLKNYIWPEEEKYQNPIYAKKMVKIFFEELAKNGTTLGFIYSSVHKKATGMALKASKKRGHFVIGNVLMDQNSPEELKQTEKEAVKISLNLAKKYGDKYALTPRFAPTCSFNLMKKGAEIAKKYNSWIQTHLAENQAEIAWVKELFPQFKSYTEVYLKAGLLGNKTILGHCIHLIKEEWQILKKNKTVIAHCPTSNEALKSGRMPIEKVLKEKIAFALGSDIGAGPYLSMLDVMRSYLDIHKNFEAITPVEALYRATLASAKIMQKEKITGNLNPGKEATFVVLQDEKISGNAKSAEVIEAMLNHPRKSFENRVQQTFFQGKCLYIKA